MDSITRRPTSGGPASPWRPALAPTIRQSSPTRSSGGRRRRCNLPQEPHAAFIELTASQLLSGGLLGYEHGLYPRATLSRRTVYLRERTKKWIIKSMNSGSTRSELRICSHRAALKYSLNFKQFPSKNRGEYSKRP